MLRHRRFSSTTFRRTAGALAVTQAAAIWYLSSRTWEAPSERFPTGFGNLLHLGLFGALSAFLTLAFTRHEPPPGGSGVLLDRRAVLGASTWGVVDEIHQWFVPGRDCSVADIVVDLCGALAASVATLGLVRSGRAARRWIFFGVFIGLGTVLALTLAASFPSCDGLLRMLLDRIFCR